MADPTPPKHDVVILVHGTFATSPSDDGDAWWQRGSDFWNWLERNLPSGVALPTDEPVFRWSGRNAESARMLGARELLRRLREYDASGIGYHLVSHSHGGSVVWTALQMAMPLKPGEALVARTSGYFRGSLSGLRSWTTVGTPFLRGGPSPVSLMLMIGAAPAVVALRGLTSLVAPEAFRVLHLLDVMATLTGLLLLSGVYFMFDPMFTAGALRAARFYGKRWLGLWSSQDEAITGLQTSRHLGGRLIPRQSVFTKPGPFATFSRLAFYVPVSALRVLVAPLYNWLVAPIGDRIAWSAIRNATIGNDRPGFRLAGVSVAPFPGEDSDFGPSDGLPTAIDVQLIASANAGAARSAPQMRLLLGRAAVGTAITVLQQEARAAFTGDELVHTSYFDSPGVRSLVAAHIRRAVLADDTDNAHEFDAWIRDRKGTVSTAVNRLQVR